MTTPVRLYSEEWLRRRLEIADDSNAGAGAPTLSCLVCGQPTLPHDVAVGHLVHTDVICCRRCKDAGDEVKRLRENLHTFGGHIEHCKTAMVHRGAKCACGFQDVWSAITGAKK